jgi:hypothetical protein
MLLLDIQKLSPKGISHPPLAFLDPPLNLRERRIYDRDVYEHLKTRTDVIDRA